MSTETRRPLTYLEMISQDEKSQKSAENKIQAQQQALTLDKAIFDLGVELNRAKVALETSKKAKTYSVFTEFTLVKTIKDLEEQLSFARNIKKERFFDAEV